MHNQSAVVHKNAFACLGYTKLLSLCFVYFFGRSESLVHKS